jgi:hypothetical protein
MTAFRARIYLKQLVQSALPTQVPPLIVASMGRSGSTVVWDSLRHAVAAHRGVGRFNKQMTRLVSQQTWDLASAKFLPGVVYKTHGLAEELSSSSGARVIFLFGSATDAALSVHSCETRYGHDWIIEHLRHLRASGGFDELANRDVLRFSEQLDGWIGKAGTPRMILRYDSLWDHEEALSDFTGVAVKLPVRKARTGPAAVDAATRARFTDTYGELDARIAALPDCQILC